MNLFDDQIQNKLKMLKIFFYLIHQYKFMLVGRLTKKKCLLLCIKIKYILCKTTHCIDYLLFNYINDFEKEM